MSIDELKHTL